MLISRKRYKIETYFQGKTNSKSYVAYRMAPVLVTLDNLEGHSWLQAFSSAIRQTFVQYFTRFQLTACSRGPLRQLGFLSSSAKLHGRRTISGKLLTFGFVATMRLLSNYFDLLYILRPFTGNCHQCYDTVGWAPDRASDCVLMT